MKNAAAVYRAAAAAMSGDRSAWDALGLPGPKNMADIDRTMSEAFQAMTPAERRADLAGAKRDLRHLNPGRPRRGAGTAKRSVTLQPCAWAVVDARADRDGVSSSEALERVVMEWSEARK